ncbi:type 1 periplasmic binding fold superfamily protein [Altibacter sp. HG106]|uniref:type 1 periplasmic binding fold superfamily protein n=1 Tax=Altibacter sp. HG106 TaxID=3023937 RepID=UPI002350AE3F|nr:type 1 periplasmic binding fold superfamily protein [Altibacter sp. HG106]MDC7993647.1 type 1 periplasmic binding fold superfamily protein [Altibacter sp. HG106]
MKLIPFLFVLPIALFTVTSCSNDDDNTPEPVNEEEVITTLTATMVAEGSTVTLRTQDLDGDGPNAPVVTVSGNFQANTTYVGGIVVLNETEDPAENITSEVLEEAIEHQFFHLVGTGLDATTTYGDFDDNGDPLGVTFTLETGAASTGTLTIVLRHEPKKPNDGTLADAGGETDIRADFNITIE